MITSLKCPACDAFLTTDQDLDGRHVAWCAHGQCPVPRMNEGEVGKTLDEAYQRLKSAYDKTLDVEEGT